MRPTPSPNKPNHNDGRAENVALIKRNPGKAPMAYEEASSTESSSFIRRVLRVVGPGLMVCLADSDVGGLLTMAQAGTSWGYSLLLLQFALVPVLYLAQELTIRLGVLSGCSLVGLAYARFGRTLGTVLLISCIGVCAGALVSEFTGVAAVGELWGASRVLSCSLSAVLLSGVILGGGYAVAEKVGLALGVFLGAFVVVAVACRPDFAEMGEELSAPLRPLLEATPKKRRIIAANVGTVITPWMLFYQQSAVVEKRIRVAELRAARIDTAVGALLTQCVMAATLVAYAAAAKGSGRRGEDLEQLAMSDALMRPLVPYVGVAAARVLLSLGLLGASLLASLVVALAFAWNVADAIKEYRGGGLTPMLPAHGSALRNTTDSSFISQRWFVVGILSMMGIGIVVVGGDLVPLVELNLNVQYFNGIAMPLTVGCLYMLASERGGALPEEHRLRGSYAVVTAGCFVLCSILTIWSSF